MPPKVVESPFAAPNLPPYFWGKLSDEQRQLAGVQNPSYLPDDVKARLDQISNNKQHRRAGSTHATDPETGRPRADNVKVWEYYVTTKEDPRRLVRRSTKAEKGATWYYSPTHAQKSYHYHSIVFSLTPVLMDHDENEFFGDPIGL